MADFRLHLVIFSLAAVWSYTSYVGIAKASAFWPKDVLEPPYFAKPETEHGLLGTLALIMLRHLYFVWLWVAFLEGVIVVIVTLVSIVKALFSNQRTVTLEKSRHTLSRILSYECALLHLLVSAIAILVVMNVPWVQNFVMHITRTHFWKSAIFLIASTFILGVFQSTADHDTTSGRRDNLYLVSAFIGYIFLHAFIVFTTVGRSYITAAIVARIIEGIQQKSWSPWLSFPSRFVVNVIELYLELYSAKICIVAATPSAKSIMSIVTYYLRREPFQTSNTEETRNPLHLTAAGLREGFIASSHLLETMFENVPVKVVAFFTTFRL